MRWSASKLSRFCAHHHVLSELHPRPKRDSAAKLGTAFHSALEDWQRTGIVPEMDGDVGAWLATMVDHGWSFPDGAELERAFGLSTWGTFVAVEETEPHVYRALDGEDLLTAGRSDIIWPHGDLIVSCDVKTGRTMPPRAAINLQVNAAGMAHCQRWKKAGYIPIIYLARSGVWDAGDEVIQGSDAWDAMLEEIKQAAALDDQPHVGPHCSDCFEAKHCSARRVQIQGER